jgi:hypothetical protein
MALKGSLIKLMSFYRTINHAHGAVEYVANMPDGSKLMPAAAYITSSILSKAKALHSAVARGAVDDAFSIHAAIMESMEDLFPLLDTAEVVDRLQAYAPAAKPALPTTPTRCTEDDEELPI